MSATAPLGRLRQRFRLRTVIALVPAAALLVCSFGADEVAVAGRDGLGIWTLLPAGPVGGNWVSAELSSVTLFVVAIALARGKQIGFWLGLSAMVGAIVVQGLQLRHPVSAVSAAILAAILLATRRRYDVATRGRERILATGLLLGGAGLVALSAGLADHGVTMPRMVTDAVAGVMDFASPAAVPGGAAIAAVFVAARIGYMLAALLSLDSVPDPRPPEEVARARRALRQIGSGALLPYQDSPACIPVARPDGRAVMAVAQAGRTAVVLGDPSGDRGAARRLVRSWAVGARRRDLVPVVYQASDAFADEQASAGWRRWLIGREAIVAPATFDLGSPRVANLRHTVARARRGGLTAVVSANGLRGLPDPRLAAALRRLDDEWRRHARPVLGFTVGQFDPDDTRPSMISVAVGPGGGPIAFAVLRPTGADGGWMLDLMRRVPHAEPGAMELALVAAIDVLGADGVERLSLGLAPLDGLRTDRGPIVERALAITVRAIRSLYDVRGLAFFKGKFDPVWVPRYLLVRRWWHLPAAILGLLRLHLGGSWTRVLRSIRGTATAG